MVETLGKISIIAVHTIYSLVLWVHGRFNLRDLDYGSNFTIDELVQKFEGMGIKTLKCVSDSL
jgi:hypothetical protein